MNDFTFDPTLLNPDLINQNESRWPINIFGLEYECRDGFQYEDMLQYENKKDLFFVLPKRRSERKWFEKWAIKKYTVKGAVDRKDYQFYLMKKSDLDKYYLKNT